MTTFLEQIQAAIARAGARSIPVQLVLEGPPPAAAHTFRVLSDELPALARVAMRRRVAAAPATPDLGSDIASARAFIATATREAAEMYLQQIRAARQNAHGTSRPVHLELDGPIPMQPRNFAVHSDDLDDLERVARDRMQALRADQTSESYQRFPQPGANSSGGPLPAELYVSPRAIDPARPVEIPEGDRTELDRIADAITHELDAWRTFRAQLHGTPPGRAVFEAVARLSGGLDDLTAGLYLARRIGTDAGHLVREMVGFSSHPGAVRLQTMLGFRYAHAIPAGHRYALSIQGGTLRVSRDGAAVNLSTRGGTLTYTNDFGMRYVQPIRATNVSLSIGVTAREVWGWFHGSGGGPTPGAENELSSTDSTVTDYSWFVPGEDFRGTFRLFQVSGGFSVGAMGASENNSGSTGVLEVGLEHGPMSFVISGTNQSVSFSGGVSPPEATAGNDIGVGAEAGIGRITTSGPQITDRPIPPPNGGGALEEHGMQPLLTTVVYFGLRDAQVPTGGNEAIAEAIATVDRFLIDFPDSRTSMVVTGYASPRWRGHANDPVAASVANYQLSMQRVHAVETQLRVALLERATGGACQVSSSVCDPPEITPEESGLGSQPALEDGVELTDASAVWHRVVIEVRGSVYRYRSITPGGQTPGRAQAGHP
ncbi:MAG TPA: hypothetical protein VFQ65_15920 [Kofleriaceae bacterium]|nr:hypothetical protein [Kofleriaceae bacterium]